MARERKATVRDLNAYRRFRRALDQARQGGWSVTSSAEAGISEDMTYLYVYDLATGELISGGLTANVFQETVSTRPRLSQDSLVGMVATVLADVFDNPARVGKELDGMDTRRAALQAAVLYFGITETWQRMEKPPAGYHVLILIYREKRRAVGTLRPFALRSRTGGGLLATDSVYRAIADVVEKDRQQQPHLFSNQQLAGVIPFPSRS